MLINSPLRTPIPLDIRRRPSAPRQSRFLSRRLHTLHLPSPDFLFPCLSLCSRHTSGTTGIQRRLPALLQLLNLPQSPLQVRFSLRLRFIDLLARLAKLFEVEFFGFFADVAARGEFDGALALWRVSNLRAGRVPSKRWEEVQMKAGMRQMGKKDESGQTNIPA